MFGLPGNNPTVMIECVDPGTQPDGTEADLDIEWSGAVAKGANVELVSSASTETTAGTDLSALYSVDNDLAPVMSESYGQCELFLGTTANAFESALWQQASAEGISVLVSAGDGGSAACDQDSDGYTGGAVQPMAVNGLESTPYDIAVGGTDFNQYNNWSQYWSATNNSTTKQSVLGYIPEIPWNDSCGGTTLDAIYGETPADGCSSGTTWVLNFNTIADGGGPSSCISSDGSEATSCTTGWPKPSWQAGAGVPSDGVRDIPDVSFFASNGVYQSAYVVCQADASGGSGCDPSASTQTFLAVGGTSASAPVMAGVMAIVDQKYGPQGNANPIQYALAASGNGASIFHDITTDGNRVACTSESPDCVSPSGSPNGDGRMKGHDSTVGYDLVTGLGSIDIANLVNHWTSAGAPTPTTTTLELNGGTATISAVHRAAIQASVNVSTASGTPQGGVSLIGAAPNGSVYLGSLSNGAVSGAVNALPGGSYAVTAHYAGNAQFSPSDSGPVNVDISPEPSKTTVSIQNYNSVTGTLAPATSVSYGSLLLLGVAVAGSSGFGAPTGSIELTDWSVALGQFALNQKGSTQELPSPLILGGSHAFRASYAGDSSFDPSAGTSTLVVTPATMSCGLQSNTSILRPGWAVVLNASAGFMQPTGPPVIDGPSDGHHVDLFRIGTDFRTRDRDGPGRLNLTEQWRRRRISTAERGHSGSDLPGVSTQFHHNADHCRLFWRRELRWLHE